MIWSFDVLKDRQYNCVLIGEIIVKLKKMYYPNYKILTTYNMTSKFVLFL